MCLDQSLWRHGFCFCDFVVVVVVVDVVFFRSIFERRDEAIAGPYIRTASLRRRQRLKMEREREGLEGERERERE